jgi:chromosome segregation ATPase
MSARQEREKAVVEHQKFLSDNTKDEQKRYNEAKAQAAALDEQNKALITQINDKVRQVSALNDKSSKLSNEILNAEADLNTIKAKIDLATIQLAKMNDDLVEKIADFDKSCADKKSDIMIKENSLKDLKDECEEAGRSAELKEANARKEQNEANGIIEASTKKLAELKEVTYDHAKTMAKYDQDRAKLSEEHESVDKDREALKKAYSALKARELAVSQREDELKKKDDVQNDKDRQLILKEGTLNKREQKVNELIQIHDLKV